MKLTLQYYSESRQGHLRSQRTSKFEVLYMYSEILFLLHSNYNHFDDILRLFDVLANFPFSTSEAMRDYYLQTWCVCVWLRPSTLKASSVWGWKSRVQINDVVLKT